MIEKDEVRIDNPIEPLLTGYGVKIRGNRYKPFCHSSDQYSGKIIDPYTCTCYVCNKTFDCFSIVGHFEGISDFKEQLKFLKGEDLAPNDPVRIKRKKQAEKYRKAEEERERKKEAFKKENREICEQMHKIRACMAVEAAHMKINGDQEPTPLYADLYNKLQYLDYKINAMFGSEGGNISIYPEVSW